MGDILKDSRFAGAVKDARFRNIPKKEKKVKIDKRFQSMFTDERFQLKSVVDKRGRPVVSKGSEHLERFYDLSDDDIEETVDETEQGDNAIESTKSTRKQLHPKVKAKLNDLKTDYARGEGCILTDSSSDEASSSEEENEAIDHGWGEFDKDAPTIEEETPRLAVCNMDWDRITAQDLMVLFNSFLPAGGLILSVTIYPSEFGAQRMEEEERQGPSELTELATSSDQEDESLTEDQREKLRQYQLKRLRYFYAVLVFDSRKTANHIYKECDGLEYESSMNRLDLRFIPDDTEFHQKPKEESKELPDLTTYKPRHFRTTALTQVKVDLTWDETDPRRQDIIRAAHEGKIDADRLDTFLASSSSDEEEETRTDKCVKVDPVVDKEMSEKSAIEKYKSLLADLEKTDEAKNEDVSMEVTWDLKLEQKAAEKVKQAVKAKDDKTPFELFLEKKKEKKKMKKLGKKTKDEQEETVDAFSDDDIPSDIDMNDPYFKEELDKMKSGKKVGTKKSKKFQTEVDEDDNQKQAELELLMMEEATEVQKNHFNLKKIEALEKKSKKKNKKLKKIKKEKPADADNFKIDVKDERFSAIFTSHLYNVDPAEPSFRPTDGMKAIIDEKLKRRLSPEPFAKVPKLTEEKKKSTAELNVLVKSIKRKTQETKRNKKLT